jgi:hypothetical protein
MQAVFTSGWQSLDHTLKTKCNSTNAMIKALARELPGIHLRFVTKAGVDQPNAAEAFVPETRRTVRSEKKPLNAETILETAFNVLGDFVIDQRKVS